MTVLTFSNRYAVGPHAGHHREFAGAGVLPDRHEALRCGAVTCSPADDRTPSETARESARAFGAPAQTPGQPVPASRRPPLRLPRRLTIRNRDASEPPPRHQAIAPSCLLRRHAADFDYAAHSRFFRHLRRAPEAYFQLDVRERKITIRCARPSRLSRRRFHMLLERTGGHKVRVKDGPIQYQRPSVDVFRLRRAPPDQPWASS